MRVQGYNNKVVKDLAAPSKINNRETHSYNADCNKRCKIFARWERTVYLLRWRMPFLESTYSRRKLNGALWVICVKIIGEGEAYY